MKRLLLVVCVLMLAGCAMQPAAATPDDGQNMFGTQPGTVPTLVAVVSSLISLVVVPIVLRLFPQFAPIVIGLQKLIDSLWPKSVEQATKDGYTITPPGEPIPDAGHDSAAFSRSLECVDHCCSSNSEDPDCNAIAEALGKHAWAARRHVMMSEE